METGSSKARDIMNPDVEYLEADATAADAAKKLADGDYGAIPVCENKHLKGLITDRDLVIKVLAEGKDPASVKVIELVRGEAITIGADDSVEEALQTMTRYGVRRLPVIDGTDMVGIVTQADIARQLPAEKVGAMLKAISSEPPNN